MKNEAEWRWCRFQFMSFLESAEEEKGTGSFCPFLSVASSGLSAVKGAFPLFLRHHDQAELKGLAVLVMVASSSSQQSSRVA